MSGPDAAAPAADKRPPRKGRRWGLRLYLVIEKQNLAAPGEANRTIVDAYRNRAKADEYVGQHPGTYVEKVTAY